MSKLLLTETDSSSPIAESAAPAPVGSASGAGASIKDANPIDPYAQSRLDEIEYRKRRERGEPFTLKDFAVWAQMNCDGRDRDTEEERNGAPHQ